jgi:hypothetical protein
MTPGTRQTLENPALLAQRRPMASWGVVDGALHFGGVLTWDEAHEILGFVADPARAQALLAEIDARAVTDADGFPHALLWRHAVRRAQGFNSWQDFGVIIVPAAPRLADEPRLVRNFLSLREARILQAVINGSPHVRENREQAARAMR